MNLRRKAALLTACTIAIGLIRIFITEALYGQVQASSFLVDNNKVVVIAADYIQLQDFAQDEYLAELFNSSHSALISGRQNGKASLAKAKLSMGTGKRLEVNGGMTKAANYSEGFEALTGEDTAGRQGNVIYQDINSLRRLNKNGDYNLYIGYLGNRLKELNKTTALIGNSDTDTVNRSSVLLAMDGRGIIDFGDVENTLMTDGSFPGGKRTDYSKLLKLYRQYLHSSDLMIIDTGDLARLEFYKSKLSAESFTAYRQAAVKGISEFTSSIINDTGEKTTVIIMSSYPSKSDLQAGFKLTPIMIYDNNGSGIIYSSSTKREGIISSLDIADFIIEKLAATEKSRLREIQQAAPLEKLLALRKELLSVSVMRLPVLTWYAIFEIIFAVISFLYMLIISRKKLKLTKLVKLTMLANIVAPGILMYMSVFKLGSAPAYFGIFILISYLLALLLSILFKTGIGRFLWAALFVNLSIVVDLIRNSAFIKTSVFGYDPIIGARFYGLGNEYEGVFIGSGILLAGCLLQHYKDYAEKWPKATSLLLIVYTGLQFYIMGMPFLGANLGGIIAAVFGYYFFYCSAKQLRIGIAKLLILALLLAAVLSAIIALDLINPSNTTHMGKFITDIRDNGIRVLYSTFARKAAMNLKLIKYTIWTKVLLCIILIITIMFFKPVRLLHNIFKKYSYFTAAWLGISVGSIVGLLVNDSGIVMAATAMIFTGYTILYVCLEERSAEN